MKNKFRKAMAVLASATMVLSTSSFLPYSNFNLAGRITANAEETECEHSELRHYEYKESTCKNEGNLEYWYCWKCDKNFSDAEGKDEIEDFDNSDYVLPLDENNHDNLVYFEEQEPTCTNDGNSEHWLCWGCGKYFSDEEGKNEVSEDDAIILAKGHVTNGEYLYNNQYHWQLCKECNQNDIKRHELTEEGKCSVCDFSLGEEYIITNGLYSNNPAIKEATLENDGYEWNEATKTITLGNVYIDGILVLPVDSVINIVEGSNPVVADKISLMGTGNLTIKGNGTLTTFLTASSNIANVLTITGGAELILNNGFNWVTNGGGVKVTNGGKLKLSESVRTSEITMDDISEIEIDVNSSILLPCNTSELEKYVPEGYKIELTGKSYMIIPEDAVLKYNSEKRLYDVFDKDGNLITGSVTLKKQYADGIGEHLAGHSLSLDGNIGVNFYMELDKSVIADTGAYMQFTLPDGSTSEVKVSEARTETLDGKEYYIFSCGVPAKNVFDKITAQMITSSKEGTEYTYYVIDYICSFCESIIENPEEYDDKVMNLVDYMIYYYTMATKYFDGNIDKFLDWELEFNDIEISEEERESYEAEFEEQFEEALSESEFTVDSLSGFETKSPENLPEGIEYYGSSLLLKSETKVRHYFKVAKDSDTSIFTGNKNGYYYIDSESIPAGQLSKVQKTEIGNGYIEYSPMNYVYEVLNSESADKNLKNLCKALYMYDQSAKEYQNK